MFRRNCRLKLIRVQQKVPISHAGVHMQIINSFSCAAPEEGAAPGILAAVGGAEFSPAISVYVLFLNLLDSMVLRPLPALRLFISLPLFICRWGQ